MRRLVAVVIFAALAGCGADGPPLRPSANLGLSVGSGGVSTNASLGASNGTVSFGVGL